MSLNEAEKVEVRTLLRLRSEAGRFHSGPSLLNLLSERLTQLTEDEVTSVRGILSEFAKIKYESGRLAGDYQHNPDEQRRLLRGHLITVINFDPDDYSDANASKMLFRGS